MVEATGIKIDAAINKIINHSYRFALDKATDHWVGVAIRLKEVDAIVDKTLDCGCGFALDKDAGCCSREISCLRIIDTIVDEIVN